MKLINFFVVALFLPAFGQGAPSAQSQAETQQLSVHISTNSGSFPAGSEIDVNVDLTNQSGSDIQIARGLKQPEMAGFEFIVTHLGSDAPVQITPYLWALNGRRAPRAIVNDPDLEVSISGSYGGGILLKSGRTAHFSALLNKLYDLTTPGSYTIQARKWPYGMSSGLSFPDPQPTMTPIESNTITITITDPPSPAINLELSAAAAAFTSGSDVDVAVTVRNITTAPVSVPFDSTQPAAERNGIRFKVSQKLTNGRSTDSPARAKHPSFWVPYGYQYAKQTALQPSQTIQYEAKITKLNDLTAPGTYTIQAEAVDPLTHLTVKSNTITIMVQ